MPIYPVKNEKGKVIGYDIRVNYTDAYGKHRQAHRGTKGSKEDAKLIERELEENVKELPSEALTVEQLFHVWLEAEKSNWKETTLSINMKRPRLYVLPYLGKVHLNKLTTPVLIKWKNQLNEKGYSLSHRQGVYAMFHNMLNFAVRAYDLPGNPLDKVGQFKEPNARKDPVLHYWTIEQINLFLDAMRVDCENNPTNLPMWDRYVFMNMLFFLGLRKGEAYARRWEDIDYDHREIIVDSSISYKVKGQGPLYSSTKTGRTRYIPINKRLAVILEEHRKRYLKVVNYDTKWYICGGINPLRDTMLATKMKEYEERLNLPHIRIHDTRHSFASLLKNTGATLEEVSRLLGHESIRTTESIYVHWYRHNWSSVISLLDTL